MRVFLAVVDAGNGSAPNRATWRSASLTMPGQPDIPLSVISSLKARLDHHRDELLLRTEAYLAAAAVALEAERPEDIDLDRLAGDRELEARTLHAWLSFLLVGGAKPVQVSGHYEEKFHSSAAGQEFIQGW
ncbi:hypothetical protein OAV21_04610 [bacterium]|nr:hypothetical protein [Verrucomicrobiales bacterium]MDC0312859.1 hypothetical protein [Verrucomicrobiales bacterium]MDC0503802.1 hypothetical protein [Verrucomicrobiales bacterium]MDC3255651.1 hypothetical protein [bacterium]MDF1788346.1 hypothetical protein [Verrucomicrobiales bacterium]